MTIGSLDSSLDSAAQVNPDFERLKETRDVLTSLLEKKYPKERWGGRLELSMGMSSDFEKALESGSDIVRVGTGIFGSRKTKDEMKPS